MFFQWVMCVAVWFMGLLTYIIECNISPDDKPEQVAQFLDFHHITNSTAPQVPVISGARCPTFEPFSMLGGVLWCLGNVWVVPIVKSVGLGLGLCIWGTTNMVVGWACGRFGILGPNASPPNNPQGAGGLFTARRARLSPCCYCCCLLLPLQRTPSASSSAWQPS